MKKFRLILIAILFGFATPSFSQSTAEIPSGQTYDQGLNQTFNPGSIDTSNNDANQHDANNVDNSDQHQDTFDNRNVDISDTHPSIDTSPRNNPNNDIDNSNNDANLHDDSNIDTSDTEY